MLVLIMLAYGLISSYDTVLGFEVMILDFTNSDSECVSSEHVVSCQVSLWKWPESSRA